jgi:hypothetical protein
VEVEQEGVAFGSLRVLPKPSVSPTLTLLHHAMTRERLETEQLWTFKLLLDGLLGET